MTSNGIPLAGVIGNPISHSLSPRLHGYWLSKYNINGYYVPICLTRETFVEGLKSLPRLGFKGVNVTIPFKELALSVAEVVTDRAALIGAANTITFRKDGKIQADNTDGYGFIQNIRQTAPKWTAKEGPSLVLGAGGASRAIISGLLSEGASEIYLANRTKSRAELLREHFGARVKVINFGSVSDCLPDVGTLINATSLGMIGQPPLNLDLTNLTSSTLVTDIVYKPLKTPLLLKAEQKGCQIVDGLGMLIHQAVPGFQNWFKREPKIDSGIRQVVLEG